MKIIHFCAGLEGWNGMANTARQFVEEELARGDESQLTNDVGVIERTEKVDRVQIHGTWLPALWKVAKLAKRKGAELIVRPCGNYDPIRIRRGAIKRLKKWLVGPFEHAMLNRADFVQCTCAAEAEWVKAYHPKARIQMTDLKRFFNLVADGSRSRTKDGSLHVLYLGRRDPLKGVEFLERAVREIGLGRRSRSTVEGKFVIVAGADAPFRKTKDALAWARATGLIGRMRAEETGGKGIVTISAESIRETLNPRQREYAQTGASKAYAYRVNEIEVVPGTLGGKIAPATYPTDTTSICGSILLQGVVDVNGRLGESKSEHSNNRTIDLRIVSDHFGEELERDWAWCDVLVLPTLSENFGRVVAEALERGKRVITTDGAPAWEPPVERSRSEGLGLQWWDRIIYLRGYRDGTDEERVRLLKEALEKV